MRVLLLTSDMRQASCLERKLKGDHEVRCAGSLAEALLDLVQPLDRPDLIVTDLDLPDAHGYSMLRSLQDAALGTPVLVCDPVDHALSVHVEAVAGLADVASEAPGGMARETMVFEQHRVEQIAAVRDAEFRVELQEVAERTARLVAERAVAELMERLDLEDREGLRMAVRLARSWDAIKARFLAGVATSLAGTLLLALGAGIAALLRQHGNN